MELLASVAAGAVGGLLVVLGERFLFAAPSAWAGLQRSFRFYRQRYQEWRGNRVDSCPRCFWPEPEPVPSEVMLPEGWEDAPPNTHWRWCPDCHHVWSVRTFFHGFRPAEEQGGDSEGE